MLVEHIFVLQKGAAKQHAVFSTSQFFFFFFFLYLACIQLDRYYGLTNRNGFFIGYPQGPRWNNRVRKSWNNTGFIDPWLQWLHLSNQNYLAYHLKLGKDLGRASRKPTSRSKRLCFHTVILMIRACDRRGRCLEREKEDHATGPADASCIKK